MSSPPDRETLRCLQSEIEDYLRSLTHPIVVENEIELIDLTGAEWRVSVEFGKLIFEAWNRAGSLARRVEQVAFRDRGRLGVYVRRPGGRESVVLEFRDLERAGRAPRATSRSHFRTQFLASLEREEPGWRWERVSNRSDREHAFSAHYTRGLARRGRTGWAFLGLDEAEPVAAADAVLAHGLIWLDWLRGVSGNVTVPQLKLFLPPKVVVPIAHRAAFLNARAVQVEIHEWRPGSAPPAALDLRDFGNVETRLPPPRQAESLLHRHQALLDELLGDLRARVDVVADPSGNALSVRVFGLEVGRVEGELAPRAYYGLEGSYRPLDLRRPAAFQQFLARVLEIRNADAPDRSHEFYRLQAERWLESLLVRDITKLDPELSPDYIYPQVPAMAGKDRGVIDILTATRQGRLAVLELKLHEEINLPFQGLDYWLRVKWLHDRGQFTANGYFPGLELVPAPPRLYFVCPAFRFHSSLERVIRYLDPSIEIVQVGVNDAWREKIQVLFRRPVERGPRARVADGSHLSSGKHP